MEIDKHAKVHQLSDQSTPAAAASAAAKLATQNSSLTTTIMEIDKNAKVHQLSEQSTLAAGAAELATQSSSFAPTSIVELDAEKVATRTATVAARVAGVRKAARASEGGGTSVGTKSNRMGIGKLLGISMGGTIAIGLFCMGIIVKQRDGGKNAVDQWGGHGKGCGKGFARQGLRQRAAARCPWTCRRGFGKGYGKGFGKAQGKGPMGGKPMEGEPMGGKHVLFEEEGIQEVGKQQDWRTTEITSREQQSASPQEWHSFLESKALNEFVTLSVTLGNAGDQQEYTLEQEFTPLEQDHWNYMASWSRNSTLTPDDYLMPMCFCDSSKDTFWKDRAQCGNEGVGGWAEFHLTLAPGRYKVFSHYASGDQRPLTFSMDGECLSMVAKEVTGGFGEDDMAWFDEGFTLSVEKTQQTIRIEAENSAYPYISAFALINLDVDDY